MVLPDTKGMVDNPMRGDEALEAMAQEVTIREVIIEMGGLTDSLRNASIGITERKSDLLVC
jgi:hypothetical protein